MVRWPFKASLKQKKTGPKTVSLVKVFLNHASQKCEEHRNVTGHSGPICEGCDCIFAITRSLKGLVFAYTTDCLCAGRRMPTSKD